MPRFCGRGGGRWAAGPAGGAAAAWRWGGLFPVGAGGRIAAGAYGVLSLRARMSAVPPAGPAPIAFPFSFFSTIERDRYVIGKGKKKEREKL